MLVPVWLLTLAGLAITSVLFFSFKYVLKLIEDSRVSALKERVILRQEMKELRSELHGRMNSTDTVLKESIKELTKSVVPKILCESNNNLLAEKFENLTNVIKTAEKTRNNSDYVAHTSLEDTLLVVVGKMEKLEDCVTKLSNKKEC